MKKYFSVFLLTLFLIATIFLSLLSHTAKNSYAADKKESTLLACSANPSVSLPGETVLLRVHANGPDEKEHTIHWEVSVGSIKGSGPEVGWDFSGVTPGDYKASVSVRFPGEEKMNCMITVLLKKSETGSDISDAGSSTESAIGSEKGTTLSKAHARRETGWAFLRHGEKEKSGYGLYSYILFGSRPADYNERARYKKTIESYVPRLDSIVNLQQAGIPTHQLNITYLPVTTISHGSNYSDLPGKRKHSRNGSVERLFEHYDYARARSILRHLTGDLRDGPYIMTFFKPISGTSQNLDKYLFQDLSTVPPKVIKDYAREFLNQSAQERF